VRGSEENLPRSGRGRKTGVRGDRIMYHMFRSDRRQSLGEITDQFSRHFTPNINFPVISNLNLRLITENNFFPMISHCPHQF
jgi:hypothetical protein